MGQKISLKNCALINVFFFLAPLYDPLAAPWGGHGAGGLLGGSPGYAAIAIAVPTQRF